MVCTQASPRTIHSGTVAWACHTGQTDAALAISRKHEAVHVAQYERWGPLMLPAYLFSSCYVYFVGKRFYRDNPFEREAYDIDGGEHDK